MKKICVVLLLSIFLISSQLVFGATYYKQIDFLLSGYRTTDDTVLEGGKVYCFTGETTTTPVTLWLDRNGSVSAPNPIILDIYGKAEIFGNGTYSFVIKDSDDVTIETILGAEYLSNVADTSQIESDISDLETSIADIATTYLMLDASNAPMTGTLPMGGFKISNVGTPTVSTDASTKGYADANVAGVALTSEAWTDGDLLVYDSGDSVMEKRGISSFLGNTSTSAILFDTGTTNNGVAASVTHTGYTIRYFMTGFTYNLDRGIADLQKVNPTASVNPTTGMVTCTCVYTDDGGGSGTVTGSVSWIAISVKN